MGMHQNCFKKITVLRVRRSLDCSYQVSRLVLAESERTRWKHHQNWSDPTHKWHTQSNKTDARIKKKQLCIFFYRRVGSIRMARLETNSAFYLNNPPFGNEHNYTATPYELDGQLKKHVWFTGASCFQQTMHWCCTNPSSTHVSSSSPWLSIRPSCQRLPGAPGAAQNQAGTAGTPSARGKRRSIALG